MIQKNIRGLSAGLGFAAGALTSPTASIAELGLGAGLGDLLGQSQSLGFSQIDLRQSLGAGLVGAAGAGVMSRLQSGIGGVSGSLVRGLFEGAQLGLVDLTFRPSHSEKTK